MQEAETHYLPLEKDVLAIIHATRKLPHYFQVQTTVVLTQLLADLVAKFTEDSMEGEMSGSKILVVSIPYLPAWKVYTDGAANQK